MEIYMEIYPSGVRGMKIPEIVLKRFGVHLREWDHDPQYRALGWDSY
jgi:hypothetical protein